MPPLSPQSLAKVPAPLSCSVRRSKEVPSMQDYDRMLNRLEKVIHRSSGPRSILITEGNPVTVSLNSGEWQYLKVKTEGLKAPLRVFVHRVKGKLVCYLSKSALEPTNLCYDEVYHKDTLEISEVGRKFTLKAVVLGFCCIEEADFTVSVQFGATRRRPRVLTRNETLADLSELRKDETKRQALFEYVEALLSSREAERSAKLASRNFIQRNIQALSVKEEKKTKRESEQQRRERILKRRKLVLEEKKCRGVIEMQKKQLKLEAEAQQRSEEAERQRLIQLQKEWLRTLTIVCSADAMQQLLRRKKEKQNVIARQMKAAVVLQRCYRKVLLTVNPKRLVRERALQHLKLLCGLFGSEVCYQSRIDVCRAIKDHFKANCIAAAATRFHARSKVHSVLLIQQMWRRYQGIKQGRVEFLSNLWDDVVKDILEDARKVVSKRMKRKVRELEAALKSIDRCGVFLSHLQVCQRRYYRDISAYITTMRAFRRGVKAFIFAKLKRGEAVFLSGAPDFRYKISKVEMREIIQAVGLDQGIVF